MVIVIKLMLMYTNRLFWTVGVHDIRNIFAPLLIISNIKKILYTENKQ